MTSLPSLKATSGVQALCSVKVSEQVEYSGLSICLTGSHGDVAVFGPRGFLGLVAL